MMQKEEIHFEDFLADVDPIQSDFVRETHDFLLQKDCTYKIEEAKSGYVLSYILTKSKKVIANYVFRKSGLIIRIYGDYIGNYTEILSKLPNGMVKAIEKAPVCKRLLDPSKCNSKCGMGYIFELNGTTHKKCRYNSFMFKVEDENHTAICDFLKHEIDERIFV